MQVRAELHYHFHFCHGFESAKALLGEQSNHFAKTKESCFKEIDFARAKQVRKEFQKKKPYDVSRTKSVKETLNFHFKHSRYRLNLKLK